MAECCVVMRNFTPDLCLLLNDITFDATSYDKQVEYGFTHPSLDIKSAPSFGSLISAMMYCVSSLSSVSSMLYKCYSFTYVLSQLVFCIFINHISDNLSGNVQTDMYRKYNIMGTSIPL